MATAVQPPATQARKANPRGMLVLAAVFGAVFILAGIAAALYAVPMVWASTVSPVLADAGSFIDATARLLTQLAVVGLFIWLGARLSGSALPHGTRGGIFLVLAVALGIFLVARSIGFAMEGSKYGLPITLAILGVLIGLGYVLLMSPRAARWMVALEDQGWFSTNAHKRTQGLRVRRYSLIGFLIIGLTGVYSLITHGSLGSGDWRITIPFLKAPNNFITLLPDVQWTLPLLLAAASFWLSWRAVNIPVFADFLIATEAEMNKVSWSTRKRLVQDTIVVLLTVILMTLFLLAVDLFWGWLLSAVGVLPPSSSQTPTGQVDTLQGKQADF